MNPQELYAEVAAIYEVCYKRAHELSLHAHCAMERQQGSTASGLASASASVSTRTSAQVYGIGLIKFPWRIASQQLREMKEKARQLAQSEVST